MDFNMLFNMQKELDSRIASEHELHNEDLFDRKVLALLVEIGELANETRCFKYWSKKGPSSRDVILEEYVDGLHFILSIGIEKGYDETPLEITDETQKESVKNFLTVYSMILLYKEEPTKKNYEQLISEFLLLGKCLGYSYKEIEAAYAEKNTVNHERQNNGY